MGNASGSPLEALDLRGLSKFVQPAVGRNKGPESATQAEVPGIETDVSGTSACVYLCRAKKPTAR